jgi:uncharacterized phage protein (TIGR01671 family)
MREIKFRGKVSEDLNNPDKYVGMWIIGDLFHMGDTVAIAPIETEKDIEGFLTGKTEGKMLPTMIVLPESVGQYAGLKDKNGAKIYGGTISQTITKDGFKLSKFVYFYNEGLARFQKRRDDGDIYDCDEMSEGGKTIIGNIHENPKLLEQGCSD